jgi:quinol monooxygenase YgiN
MNDDRMHVVLYVEVMAPTRPEAAALLARYGEATRAAGGNLRCEVVSRVGQPHQFAVLEVWADEPSREAHGRSTAAARLREGIQAIRVAPLDERVHVGVSVGPLAPEGARAGLHVVTHVDVVPPRKDDGLAALVALAEASRGGPGNLRFEVVQQSSRPNHFTVLEAWTDADALAAHAMAEATRRFRDALGPMSGALYDERLYTTSAYST